MKLIRPDLFLKKKENIIRNTYYFGEYMPVIIECDNRRVISMNVGDRNVYDQKTNGEVGITSYDTLIQDKNAIILAVVNIDPYKRSSIFKIEDETSFGIIEAFPIIDKILKVKVNSEIYDLDVLNKEVPCLIKTSDNIYVYDFNMELCILNLQELNHKTLTTSKDNTLSLLHYKYDLNEKYKIFKSRENMKIYLEEYLKEQ